MGRLSRHQNHKRDVGPHRLSSASCFFDSVGNRLLLVASSCCLRTMYTTIIRLLVLAVGVAAAPTLTTVHTSTSTCNEDNCTSANPCVCVRTGKRERNPTITRQSTNPNPLCRSACRPSILFPHKTWVRRLCFLPLDHRYTSNKVCCGPLGCSNSALLTTQSSTQTVTVTTSPTTTVTATITNTGTVTDVGSP